MKVLERETGETWRECIERVARDHLETDDVSGITDEFDGLIVLGEEPNDAAWFVAEAYGLLSEIRGGIFAPAASIPAEEIPF